MKQLAYRVFVLLFRLQWFVTRKPEWIGFESMIRRAYWTARLANMGSQSGIFRDVVIHCPQKVSIGNRCVIAEFVHIWGGGGVSIGDDVLLASHVAITSMSHATDAPVFASTSVKKTVVIENNVWVGAGAVILPGVRLGTGCIVGSGAVVTKDVPSNCIVVGVPARPLRQRRVLSAGQLME